MATYDLGDRVRVGNHSALSGVSAFKNSAGSDADPDDVLLTVKKPDNTYLRYRWPTPGGGELALTKETTGRFYADIDLDTSQPVGTWAYRLAGTGVVMAAEEGAFTVKASTVL